VIEPLAIEITLLVKTFIKVLGARLGLSLTALALIVGCKVGPDYKRPDATTVPAAYT